MVNILIPSEWYINIKRTDEGLYKLEYKEMCIRPQEVSPRNFKIAIDNTLKVIKKALEIQKFEFQHSCSDDVFEMTLIMTGDLNKVANAVVSEFLPLSDLGKLTLGEIYYQMIYSQVVDTVK